MSDELIAKLNAALDEDERVALSTHDADEPWSVEPFQPTEPGGLPGSTWVVNGPDGENGVAVVQGSFRANHIVRHDPARVLRQVAAIRKVLAAYQDESTYLAANLRADGGVAHGLWTAIEAFAEAYGIEP